jgi:DNA-binding beta-propeller fold protein YncE
MKRPLMILLLLFPALGAALLLHGTAPGTAEPALPGGGLVLPLAVTGPRALAAGNGLLWAIDDKGWIRMCDYDGRPRGARRLIRTIRGFPNGATFEPDGTVLVADSHESRLLRLLPDGEKVDSFGGGYGCLPGQFVYPQRIALVGDRAYITEFGYPQNCRVQVFTRKGKFLFTFGTHGQNGAHFARPAGIAASPDGRMFVADASHRILVWSGDGEYLGDFGGPGTGPGQLEFPWGVTTDGHWLYVTEFQNHRISRFGFDGKFAGLFTAPGLLRLPRDLVAVDGWLFVADTGHDRVLRFAIDRIPWRDRP